MNSIRVEFADGWVMITSRYAVRRLPRTPAGATPAATAKFWSSQVPVEAKGHG